eukprot:5977651-Prymnesium_polylepis.1
MLQELMEKKKMMMKCLKDNRKKFPIFHDDDDDMMLTRKLSIFSAWYRAKGRAREALAPRESHQARERL